MLSLTRSINAQWHPASTPTAAIRGRTFGAIRIAGDITVRQRPHKCHDVLDLVPIEAWLRAWLLSFKRRIAVDVRAIFGRQIVVDPHAAVRVLRVPAFGRDVARDVELDDFAQIVKASVVEERLAQRDVA